MCILHTHIYIYIYTYIYIHTYLYTCSLYFIVFVLSIYSFVLELSLYLLIYYEGSTAAVYTTTLLIIDSLQNTSSIILQIWHLLYIRKNVRCIAICSCLGMGISLTCFPDDHCSTSWNTGFQRPSGACHRSNLRSFCAKTW